MSMTIKKAFSFDEEKDAIKTLEEGFPNNKIDYSKMYTVAKYLRQEFGYGEIRLERELIKFCKIQDINFNSIVEVEAIKKWVKTAMRYELRKITCIEITESEYIFLAGIEIPRDRRVLFATLLIAKALKQQNTKITKKERAEYTNAYIHYGNMPDIVKLSGVSHISENKMLEILYKYKNNLTLYNPEKELVRIDFVDEESPMRVAITNFDNIMVYYEAMFGKIGIKCSICGKMYVPTGRWNKYCETCRADAKREQKRDYMRERRKGENIGNISDNQ